MTNTKAITLSVLLFVFSVGKVAAIEAPSFPSCENPSGILRVSYDDGVHGIAGQSAEYRGSDRVYIISDTQVLQCFCPADANGIQTNWWKVSSLSQAEIDSKLSAGWVYIPNGALWGLDPDPYLAINNSFSCGEKGGSSSSSSVVNTVSSTVQSVFPQILGFAETGRKVFQTLMSLTGLFCILIAMGMLWFQRKSKPVVIQKQSKRKKN